MKNKILTAGLAFVLLAFASCKNEEEMKAQKNVDDYSSYVDSISNVDMNNAKGNWDSISAQYERRMAEAEASVDKLKDKVNAQNKLESAKAKYEEYKAKVVAEVEGEKAKATEADRPTMLRSQLFAGKMTGDSYDWVNKDNIVSVYENFVDNFKKNKDSYTREDYDKIKQMYEALDARKNTVEKEGLSTRDNLKIAGIKTGFAPVFKWDRIGAKAEENADAKDKAK